MEAALPALQDETVKLIAAFLAVMRSLDPPPVIMRAIVTDTELCDSSRDLSGTCSACRRPSAVGLLLSGQMKAGLVPLGTLACLPWRRAHVAEFVSAAASWMALALFSVDHGSRVRRAYVM